MASSGDMRGFEDIFGQAKCVDYGLPTDVGDFKLPMPSTEDPIKIMAWKLEHLAEVVKDGKSLAVYTGASPPMRQTHDAEKEACLNMNTDEYKQYQAWKIGARMPVIDWKKNTMPIRATMHVNHKTLQVYAAALDAVYKREGTTVGNALWVAKNMAYMLHLLSSVNKVAEAKKGASGAVAALKEQLEMVEGQTADEILLIATEATDRIEEVIRGMQRSKDFISARAQAMKRRHSEIGDEKTHIKIEAPVTPGRVKRDAAAAHRGVSSATPSKRRRVEEFTPKEEEEEH